MLAIILIISGILAATNLNAKVKNRIQNHIHKTTLRHHNRRYTQ